MRPATGADSRLLRVASRMYLSTRTTERRAWGWRKETSLGCVFSDTRTMKGIADRRHAVAKSPSVHLRLTLPNPAPCLGPPRSTLHLDFHQPRHTAACILHTNICRIAALATLYTALSATFLSKKKNDADGALPLTQFSVFLRGDHDPQTSSCSSAGSTNLKF